MLNKTEKKEYTCEICKAVRSSKQYLHEHIAEEHTKEYIYKCKACDTALNHHKKSCLAYLVPYKKKKSKVHLCIQAVK